MEISNRLVIISILVLFLVVSITLFNIHVFMDSESKCTSSFNVISKCGCIPDENMAKLFNQPFISGVNLNGSK